ncbi:ATP-binding protein [Kitasatospora misakiensis]|uniref:histidine kinase n=1 Tax=Kitasatospora misakiensis TaxID=67330 RepID=A0ABW0X000_9ACTN
MTQWCATATGVLAALALVAAARYRAVSATQRRRVTQQQHEIARLQERLTAELSHRSAELAAVQHEQELNASTQRAFLSVARRILVMAHDQQALLDEMERTHDDPTLLEGLLKADHAAAQQARLAQTLAVLCGARAGRHWPEPVSLEDVVRGAQSRILPFQRVMIRSRLETAVVGAAAEALIHAVAELLDNATRYSPPSTQVFVTLMPVHNGAVIEIDDGGVGMPEPAVAKAADALAGGSGLEVSRLGEVPQLGLAAVGRLCEQYGFRVTLSSAPSPYGGVRVVVLLPNALLTEPLPPTLPGPGRGDAVFGRTAAPAPSGPHGSAVPPAGPGFAPDRPLDRPSDRPLDRPHDRPLDRPDRAARSGSGASAAYDPDELYHPAPGGPAPYDQAPYDAYDPAPYDPATYEPPPYDPASAAGYPAVYPPVTGYPQADDRAARTDSAGPSHSVGPAHATAHSAGPAPAGPPAADGSPPPLPRRSHRRGRAASRHAAAAAPTPPPAPPSRSARQAQAFMTMFQAGTAGGRSAARSTSQDRPADPTHPARQDRTEPPLGRAGDRFPAPGHPGDHPPVAAQGSYDPTLPPSPQLPQRSGEFHDHHP